MHSVSAKIDLNSFKMKLDHREKTLRISDREKYLVLKGVDAWQRVGKGHVVSRDSAGRQSGDKQSACHWNDNFLETHAFQAPIKGGRCWNRYKRVKTVQIYSTIKIDLIRLTNVNKA